MTEVERLRLENRQLKAKIKEQEVYDRFLKKVREIQNKERMCNINWPIKETKLLAWICMVLRPS